MAKGISKPIKAHELEPVSLSELIHQHVRAAIEVAVHAELRAALGTSPYERSEGRRGYRNGIRERTLTGPTGPVALALPRATLFRGASAKEWTSTIVPRYQRRMPEVNEAVVATYLAGGMLFSLVASGQIKLRRIDGWRKIAAVLRQHTAVAA
jgi:transposase-like protein